MTEIKNYLDFEIVKENWNMYNIFDGSKLKTRIILQSVWYTNQEGDKKQYGFTIKNLTVLICHTTLQGEKGQTKYSQEQIIENIDVDECRYDTIDYEANQYVLEDGTKMLIHPNLQKVSRTKLYGNNGDRIYNVNVQASMNITPPKL